MNIKELKVRLDELYTSNNSALLNYIKHSGEFDWDYYTEEFFCDWYATLPQFGKEELADVLNTDVEELSTTPPENGWYKNTKLFADNFVFLWGG